jgi:hypothetical protein
MGGPSLGCAGSRWSTRRYLNMDLLKEDRHAAA